MTIFHIPNPTQYLNYITTLLTINKQQFRKFEAKVMANSLLITTLNKVRSTTQFIPRLQSSGLSLLIIVL